MPYGGGLHVSQYLTNLAIKYSNNDFLRPKIFSSKIPMTKESGLIPVYNYERRVEDLVRGNKSPANMISWGVSSTSYVLTEIAAKDGVSERDRANSDPAIQVDISTMENLIEHVMLVEEKRCADVLFTSGTWSNNATNVSATSWRSNTTTSLMFQNILSATGVILRWTGKNPNTLIMGFDPYASARENPQNYARIQYAERAILTEDIIAAMADVDRFLIGKSSYNTAVDGLAATTTFLWGNKALLAYFDPSPGLRKISAAYDLQMAGFKSPYGVKKWYDNDRDCDMIQVGCMTTVKAVATLAAYFWSAVCV